MDYTRIYCDAGGESHFEDVSVNVAPVDFAPPALSEADRLFC